jgi:hypothetical protein
LKIYIERNRNFEDVLRQREETTETTSPIQIENAEAFHDIREGLFSCFIGFYVE